MITILIVDDEKNIRAGINKILLESIRYPVRFLEARNGMEALETVRSESPELVITDIRMPKMDGVAFMKEVSAMEAEGSPARRPAIVVLSGYDDFTYAQNAIRYGALSYILKPVDRNELIATVTKAMAKIEAERKKAIEVMLKKMIEAGRQGRDPLPGNFSLAEAFRFAILNAPGDAAALKPYEFGSLWYVAERKSESLGIIVKEDRLPEIERAIAGTDLCLGVSSPCANAANLRTAKRQAELALLQRFFRDDCRVFFHSDPGSSAELASLESTAQKLAMFPGTGNPEELSECLDSLFDFRGKDALTGAKTLFVVSTLLDSVLMRKYRERVESDAYLMLKGIMLENVFQFRSVDEYRAAVGDFVIYLDTILRKGHLEYPFIAEAIEYIRLHYTEDINMTVVANHVSVNYTYFSEKFKEHTGINFNDYLKNLRIGEAKRLLEKGCYKVYEVSRSAGFGDVKYFMKTFKEITGLSPGEYRKRF